MSFYPAALVQAVGFVAQVAGVKGLAFHVVDFALRFVAYHTVAVRCYIPVAEYQHAAPAAFLVFAAGGQYYGCQ